MADSSTNPKVCLPRWLKVPGIVFVLLAVAFVGWHIIGGALGGPHHGPRDHAWAGHTPPASHTSPSKSTPSVEHALHEGEHTVHEGDTSRDTPRPAPPSAATPPESTSRQAAQLAAGQAAIAGCWDLTVKEHPLRGRFSFEVEGSSLRGTVVLHGEGHQIRDGVIRGHRFDFRIEMSGTPAQFDGELNQSELRGSLTRTGQRLSWVAQRCPSQ